MHKRSTHTLISFIFITATLLMIEGCKLGYNKTPKRTSTTLPAPDCAQSPANANINENTFAVFNLLSNLSCGALTKSNDGYLVGQSVGNGNQIADAEHPNSYTKLVDSYTSQTSTTPALVAIDYEYEQRFTLDELIAANDQLAAHWDKGGFVSISWTPLNPWTVKGEDIASNRGTQADSHYTESVDLVGLLDDSLDINSVWQQKLKLIADALENLQTRNSSVSVLFRPLPEMNTNKYWWGLDATKNSEGLADAALYTNLWENIYEYFKDRGLNNILWVYGPGESTGDCTIDTTSTNIATNKTCVSWAYPGSDHVDIIAGTSRNDQLNIKDYSDLLALNKPLAMANYGPQSSNGRFDNVTYADRLDGSYNYISYWVSWHTNKAALIDNQNSSALSERPYIFNVEDKKRED